MNIPPEVKPAQGDRYGVRVTYDNRPRLIYTSKLRADSLWQRTLMRRSNWKSATLVKLTEEDFK